VARHRGRDARRARRRPARSADARGARRIGPRALLGDLLALVGALTAATYFVAGRRLRGTLELWAYVGLVYGSCFVVLLLLALVASRRSRPAAEEIAIFAGLALGPCCSVTRG
jgi:drug/metabolite transporter (DMT)-like permease